jgi:hypothetical protein
MRFIAYFDYLGFANFVNENSIADTAYRLGHNLGDIEFAMSDNKQSETPNPDGSVPADLSNIKCNCVQFSDTIIFYSDDFKTLTSKDIIYQLIDIIKVCYEFNLRTTGRYPVRGCLLIGELEHDYLPLSKGSKKNKYHYYRNGIYGKGLVEAHELGENQNWAGIIVSDKIIELLASNGYIDIIAKYFIKYKVPFKKEEKENNGDRYRKIEVEEEFYCFRLIPKAPDEERASLWLQNYGGGIKSAFEFKQRLPLHNSVVKKLENTMRFFEYCLRN